MRRQSHQIKTTLRSELKKKSVVSKTKLVSEEGVKEQNFKLIHCKTSSSGNKLSISTPSQKKSSSGVRKIYQAGILKIRIRIRLFFFCKMCWNKLETSFCGVKFLTSPQSLLSPVQLLHT